MVYSARPEPALSVVEWGDIRRQTRDRLIHVSIGRFALFAHFVFFRGPNSYRVTRVNDTRYMVLLCSCSQKNSQRGFFCEQEWFFRPASGEAGRSFR
jgi:hypothetical protein